MTKKQKTPPPEVLFLQMTGLLFLIAHVIVFLGVFLQGVYVLSDKTSPLLTALLFLSLGLVFTLISLSYLPKLFSSHISKKLKLWKQTHGMRAFITTIIVLSLYALRFEIGSLLLYIGFSAGNFFLNQAHLAYERLFHLSFSISPYRLFSWVFQWYFIYYILQWGQYYLKKLQKKKNA